MIYLFGVVINHFGVSFMPILVRAAALTNYVEVARMCELDPWQMIRLAGLPAACLTDRELKVPTDRVAQLLESSAASSGKEAFALLMVEGRRFSNLGVLGLLTREEPNVRAAIVTTGRYGRVHNDGMILNLEEGRGIATIRIDQFTQSKQPVRQSVEMLVSVILKMIRLFIGPQWHPRRVCFSHAKPEDLGVHRRVLGQTIDFNCEFSGIVCTSEDMDTPIATADPVMSDFLQKQLRVSTLISDSVEAEVRHMIAILMPRGRCSAEHIARLMGINRKTLFTRLRAEGRTFSELLHDIRSTLACRHMVNPYQPLGTLATLLGFSTQSAFSRWYRVTFGVTAEQARKRQLAGSR